MKNIVHIRRKKKAETSGKEVHTNGKRQRTQDLSLEQLGENLLLVFTLIWPLFLFLQHE